MRFLNLYILLLIVIMGDIINEEYTVPINKLLKITPKDLLEKMKFRGWKYNQEMISLINKFNSLLLKNNYKLNELDSLYDIPNIIVKTFKLFYRLKDYNIDYLIYINIYLSLDKRTLINLYRHLLVKWSRLKNKYINNNLDVPDELNYNFTKFIFDKNYIMEKLQDIILVQMIEFAESNKINILFILNIFQEYLCPQN